MTTLEIAWTVVMALGVIGFIAWAAWDSGYDAGWMDHSEGKNR